MTNGDEGLEIDLNREGTQRKRKKRDWTAIGMNVGKFIIGIGITVMAAWGSFGPETRANEAAASAESSYGVTKQGIESLSSQLTDTKAALSILIKRFSDHTEAYHALDKRLIRIEVRLEVEDDISDELGDEELDIITELDAIRRELEATPLPPAAPGPMPKISIKQDGQQIRLPSPGELFK